MSDTDTLGGNAQSQLRSIMERVERLEAEKAEVAALIKEVFAEAKGHGFDVKILRKVVRLRKQDRAKRLEEEALLDLYLSALGELSPFEGRAAKPEGISSITITAGGRSVTTTPEVMQAALSSLKSEDELYAAAVQVVRRDLKASTSYVQRRLQLGYNKAASLIERMEREGIVGPPNAAGKREILEAQT